MSAYALVKNFYDLQRYVKTCADRANLQVVWGKSDETPHTDGKRVVIPRPDETWDEERMMQTKYALAHEVAHCLYTDFDYNGRDIKEVSMKSRLGMLWNVLEDHRIDHLNSLQYVGDYELCKQTYKSSYNSFNPSGWTDKEFLGAIIGNIICARTWQPDLVDVSESLYAALDDEARAHADRFIETCAGLIDEARNTEDLSGTGITYKAAVAFLGTDEEKKAQDKAEAEGGSGTTKGSADKDADAESKEAASMAEQVGTEPDMSRNPSDKVKGGRGESDRYGDYTPDPLSEMTIDDFVSKKFDSDISTADSDSYVTNFVLKNLTNAAGMANQLRTKLQIMSRSRTQYGTKSGKLHGNALHRICIPDAPHDYASRIFKRKENALNLDVSVTVLVDMSGSMHGSKYQHAALAVTLLNEALGTVLRIPIEILGFTERPVKSFVGRFDDYRTHMVVLKNFNSAQPRAAMIDALGKCSNILCENTDGEALLFAHDRLTKQRTKRKVMFVLSDGYPAGGYAKGSIRNFTEHVIKYIERKSPVEVYGVGLMSDSVSELYKEHTVIKNAGELESKLISVITKKVFGV